MELLITYEALYSFGSKGHYKTQVQLSMPHIIEFHVKGDIYTVDEFDDQMDFLKKFWDDLQYVTFILEYSDKNKTLYYHNVKEMKYHSMIEPSYWEKIIGDNKSYQLKNSIYCIDGEQYSKTEFSLRDDVKREILKSDRKNKVQQMFDIEEELEQTEFEQGGIPEKVRNL